MSCTVGMQGIQQQIKTTSL